MNPVVHFELPYEDSKRMADFYTKAFDWETNQLGPEMGSYVVAMTTETGADNRPKVPGAINGGFFKRTEPKQGPSLVIAVDDIMAHLKKVEEAGGEILGGSQGKDKPDDIPGVGLFASFLDTEGNRIGLLQAPKGM